MTTISQKLGTVKRGAAYIRESTEEQDKGFSPQNQERNIKEYAKKNNIQVINTYKDLVSGTSATKRDNFQKMISDAMQKKFDVIIVFHTSRFARNVQEARQYKDLLRKKLGIDVVFVMQQFGNFNDPSAFLNEGINELFDEHYSRQLSFWVKSGLMEKRRQGRPIGGSPPYGYTRKKVGFDEAKQRVIYSSEWDIDEAQAQAVRKMFTLYASGNHSMADIANILTNEGFRTRLNNPFTYSTIKCMFQNKTYLGLVYSPRRNLPDLKSIVHKPIISKQLFDSCQDMLHDRSKRFGRPTAKHRHYMLQGLIFCHNCAKKLNKETEASSIRRMQPSMYCEAHRWKGNERNFYACKFRRENNSCKQPSVKCDIIDKQVSDLMQGFILPVDIINLTIEKLSVLFKINRENKQEDDLIAKLIAKRKKLRYLFVDAEDMTEDEYQLKTQKIDEEIERLKRQGFLQNMNKKQEEEFLHKTESLLKNFPSFWNSDMNKEEQRKWIQLTIKRIWIGLNKVKAVEPREEYKALFQSHRKVISQLPVIAPLKISLI